MPDSLNILFLCTGHSCRSQIAEGWARHVGGDHVEVESAGIEGHGKNPRPLTDPAKATGTEEEIMSEFRATRDEVKTRVRDLLAELTQGEKQ